MSNNIFFGADPEVFATYEKDGEKFVLPPVYFRKYLGVSTDENGRHPIFVRTPDFILHEDGAAFELAVPPSHKPMDIFERVQMGYSALDAMCRKLDGSLSVSPLPTVGYEVGRWINEDRHFRYCNRFGCDPDQDAFNTNYHCTTVRADLHPERYGGGHIHCSGMQIFEDDPVLSIQTLAITAGVAAIAISDVEDLERRRTFLYGKPGKFRPQKYSDGTVGIEYRTPSNTWTKRREFADFIFSWFKVGLSLIGTDTGNMLLRELQEESKTAILQADKDLAKELLTRIEGVA